MKNIKKNLMRLLFLLGTAMLAQIPARAETGLGEVLGAAWTIGNAIVGETTLTPAYAVETYYHRDQTTGVGPGVDYSTIKRYRRSRVTGDHIYYTKGEILGYSYENNSVFSIDSVNKLNTACTYTLGQGIIATDLTVENHTEWVWLAKVESTGLWPDDGPWMVWLKTSGSTAGCGSTGSGGKYYWTPASLTKSGGQVVSIGVPNCHLDYPFYLANEFYK